MGFAQMGFPKTMGLLNASTIYVGRSMSHGVAMSCWQSFLLSEVFHVLTKCKFSTVSTASENLDNAENPENPHFHF